MFYTSGKRHISGRTHRRSAPQCFRRYVVAGNGAVMHDLGSARLSAGSPPISWVPSERSTERSDLPSAGNFRRKLNSIAIQLGRSYALRMLLTGLGERSNLPILALDGCPVFSGSGRPS